MSDNTKSDTQEQLAQKFAEATDKVKATAEEMQGKMATGEKLSTEAKEKADEALVKYNELKAVVDDIEQKSNRRGGGEAPRKSVGMKFAESEELKAFAHNPRAGASAKMHVKDVTITSDTSGSAGSAGSLVAPDRRGIIPTAQRRLTVRDLLMAGTTNSNAITYMRESGFTNNAGVQVKEGDAKPQSDLKFDEVTVSVKTLAHWAKASRQILDDAPMLASYIENRLMYGLKLVEEMQILNGDGTGGNLKGIIPQATAFANKTTIASYTPIDQLRLAMLQAILAEYPASGHVLNPIDWATIELTKDSQNRYIIGEPQDTTTPTLWGLPVVETQSMAAGKFLTGAFDLGAQLFDRQEAAVATSMENQDDFIRNLVTILVEERLALAVYRPEAFVYGTFGA